MGPNLAKIGKSTSSAVAKFKNSSSGRRVMGNRAVQSMARHPYRTAAGGMMIAGGIASGRRRSGLDKVQGRPTGIYGY